VDTDGRRVEPPVMFGRGGTLIHGRLRRMPSCRALGQSRRRSTSPPTEAPWSRQTQGHPKRTSRTSMRSARARSSLFTTTRSAASDRKRPDDVSVVGKHSDHTGHRMSNAENRMVGMDILALGQGGKAPPCPQRSRSCRPVSDARVRTAGLSYTSSRRIARGHQGLCHSAPRRGFGRYSGSSC
jgi:hypothetical protein